GAAGGLVGLWLLGLVLWPIPWTRPAGALLPASVVQGNVEQSLKWAPDGLLPTLEIYLGLTRAVLGSALIVWPETAIPEFLHHPDVQTMVSRLGESARAAGSEVVFGVPAMDPDGYYYNALVSIGSASDRYDKRHLVPFGEYLPFKRHLRPLIDWFEVPMSDFSRGRAARPLLQVGPHLVGASICYEDVFPDQVREALPEAAWLINVSNDAWFGDSLAPHQHLEFARMRALENGRDLVRSTNTGISAIIDHRGRVRGQIPSFARGTLTVAIQPRVGTTPFSRLGSGVSVGLALSMLLAALLVRWRRPVPD
ncbi:MAG: apolipoprotein N-acyltransferase, partial [Chromatiaceae bacterium]